MARNGPSRIQRALSAVARGYVNGLPKWPGKWRLLHPMADTLVAQVRPDVWIRVDPRIGVEASLLYRKLRHDDREIAFLWDALAPGMTVVDVGAFVGVMAMLAARKVGPEGRVLAFEAGPFNMSRLVRNRDLNQANNVTLCAIAVGDRNGFIEYYENGSADQSSVGYSRSGGTEKAIMVPVMPLDESLSALGSRHVDLIKVDVEGAESSVLAGAEGLLSGPDAPLLLIEVNKAALEWAGTSAVKLVEMMLGFGYEPLVLEVAPWRAYANVVAIKPQHREQFPQLAQYDLAPLLTHEWYRGHVLGEPVTVGT